MSSALLEVVSLVRRESGIEVGPAQFAALQAAIARVEPGMTPERLLASAGSEALVQRLVNEVTIRETFFFRHRGELEAIDWHRSLAAANRRGSGIVRVWVAGCASGEEAYTLAILACEAFACATPPVHVLATDIATAALEQAQRASYAPRSVSTVSDDLRRRYFTARDGLLYVDERLRRLVEFRRQNLVRDLTPGGAAGGFDVISCRNVLIYFEAPTVERVMRSLESALAPQGTLVLGAADRLSARPARIARPASAGPSRREGARPARTPPASPKHQAQPKAGRSLREAFAAADRGELDLVLEITAETLTRDPLDADAYYLRGLAELAAHEPRAAIASLRRAIYIDAEFSPALFNLARAHDVLGSADAACQAYERCLRSLSRYAEAPHDLAHTIDLTDIAVACHARLGAYAASGASSETDGVSAPLMLTRSRPSSLER
jgi:chemotaxis protein methyltransferase CheR